MPQNVAMAEYFSRSVCFFTIILNPFCIMTSIDRIEQELNELGNSEKAKAMAKFFQVFPGGYGEGDSFIGVTVPNQRLIAKKYYREICLDDIENLLSTGIHEYRLTALFMLVLRFDKAKDENQRESIVALYLKNIKWVNNWDLVDSSAHLILGPHLYTRSRDMLYEMAKSPNIWIQRIAIIATLHFIRKGQFSDTLGIAELLLHHEHDLIHKAVGWMLREVGNRDYHTEYAFLKEHYKHMPRTMLRYAIERFPEPIRQDFLKGSI